MHVLPILRTASSRAILLTIYVLRNSPVLSPIPVMRFRGPVRKRVAGIPPTRKIDAVRVSAIHQRGPLQPDRS